MTLCTAVLMLCCLTPCLKFGIEVTFVRDTANIKAGYETKHQNGLRRNSANPTLVNDRPRSSGKCCFHEGGAMLVVDNTFMFSVPLPASSGISADIVVRQCDQIHPTATATLSVVIVGPGLPDLTRLVGVKRHHRWCNEPRSTRLTCVV